MREGPQSILERAVSNERQDAVAGSGKHPIRDSRKDNHARQKSQRLVPKHPGAFVLLGSLLGHEHRGDAANLRSDINGSVSRSRYSSYRNGNRACRHWWLTMGTAAHQ